MDDDTSEPAHAITLPPALLQRGVLQALTVHNLPDGVVDLDYTVSQLHRLTLLDIQRCSLLPSCIRCTWHFVFVCLME